MDKIYMYRLTEYPNAPVGRHFSVDVYCDGQWNVSKLYREERDAVTYLSQLTRSVEPV
jgi:hypothetical protein